LNITVFGMPGAWPGELACFAANIANYFFFHWLRLSVSGIFKQTARKNAKALGARLVEVLKSVGIKDNTTAAFLVYLVARVVFGNSFALRLANSMGDSLISSSWENYKRFKKTIEQAAESIGVPFESNQPDYGSEEEYAYAKALESLSSFTNDPKAGGITAAVVAGILGEMFRVFGLEGVSIDSRYDHLSCIYSINVKAMFSDAMTQSLPMFFNHSIANALHLSHLNDSSVGGDGDKYKVLLTMDDGESSLLANFLVMESFVPYPISIGYNNVKLSSGNASDSSESNEADDSMPSDGLTPKACVMLGEQAVMKHNVSAMIYNSKAMFGNLVAHAHLPDKMKLLLSDGLSTSVRYIFADDDRSKVYKNMYRFRNELSSVLVGHTGLSFERLYISKDSLYKYVSEVIRNKSNGVLGAKMGYRLPLSPTASMIWYMYGE